MKVFVAGHNGMVGSAVVRRYWSEPVELLTCSRDQLDLCNQAAVNDFFERERPDVVVFCAARVGGIFANTSFPADFAYENLAMTTNAIDAAYRCGVERFLFLGSTCIYPRDCPQPIQEAALLTGPLEETNEGYAIAKIAGLKLCQYFRRQYGVMFHSVMPTNLYGPGDNYHPEYSHVVAALIRRFHEAKVQGLHSVTIWGSGKPRREFLFVDDLADAIVHVLQLSDPPDWVNIGTGHEISIQALATLIAEIIGFDGEIVHDLSKPDGTPCKRTDTTRLTSLGWQSSVGLEDGIARTYSAFIKSPQALTN